MPSAEQNSGGGGSGVIVAVVCSVLVLAAVVAVVVVVTTRRRRCGATWAEVDAKLHASGTLPAGTSSEELVNSIDSNCPAVEVAYRSPCATPTSIAEAVRGCPQGVDRVMARIPAAAIAQILPRPEDVDAEAWTDATDALFPLYLQQSASPSALGGAGGAGMCITSRQREEFPSKFAAIVKKRVAATTSATLPPARQAAVDASLKTRADALLARVSEKFETCRGEF